MVLPIPRARISTSFLLKILFYIGFGSFMRSTFLRASGDENENGKGHKQSLVVEFTKRRHGETYYELALSAKQRMEREGLNWTQARALRSSAP